MEPAGIDPGSLDRLRDIVPPPAPPWWPPAVGWMILMVLALVACLVLLALLVRRHRRNRYRREALLELEGIRSRKAVGELPALVRRTALAAWGREQVVRLTGDAWLRFLDERSGTRVFTTGAGRHLVNLAYDPGAEVTGDEDALFTAARTFITRHRGEA